MWSGSLTQIPIGWALCNGTKVNNFVTPNLVDKFVVGAGSGYSVSAVGGTPNAVVVEHTHSYNTYRGFGDGGGQYYDAFYANMDGVINAGGAKVYVSSSTGESGAGKNLPPYYALYYIVRVS